MNKQCVKKVAEHFESLIPENIIKLSGFNVNDPEKSIWDIDCHIIWQNIAISSVTMHPSTLKLYRVRIHKPSDCPYPVQFGDVCRSASCILSNSK